MDALSLTLPIVTVVSLIIGVFILSWKMRGYIGKVDAVHNRMDKMEENVNGCEKVEDHEDKFSDHEERLRDLEKDKVDLAAWRSGIDVTLKNMDDKLDKLINNLGG